MLPRTIRTDRRIFSSMRSARVDLVRSRSYFVHFVSVSAVPNENINFHIFQHLETPKNQLSRFFSNFSAHASSLTSAKLSNPCKIRILARLLQLSTKLRITDPAHHPGPQISNFRRAAANRSQALTVQFPQESHQSSN